MKLSRTIAYGIHATVQLARAEPALPVPCSQLARDGSMPERFLVQILRALVTQGVLKSTCGVSGGYSLARPAEEITLLEIIEAFDNTLDVNLPVLSCMSPDVRDLITHKLGEATAAARLKLRTLTVADLVRRESDTSSRQKKARQPTEIGLPLLDPNDYDTKAGDSPVIR